MVKAEVYGPGTYDSCANKVKKLTGVVLIFHPGCGHCVQMRPEWEAMKQILHPSTHVMEVDGSEMSENNEMRSSIVAQKLQGFPTILRMRNGKVVGEFRGQRNVAEMKQFAENGAKRLKTKKTRKTKGRKKPRKTKRR
jgi:hypothetical protein